MASREFNKTVSYIRRWVAFMNSFDEKFDLETARDNAHIAVTKGLDYSEIEILNAGGVTSSWISEPGSDPDKRILYLHGGGFVAGNVYTHRNTAKLISKYTGCSVLLAGYRLAPEYPFPHALNDAVKAYEWMDTNGPDGRGHAEKMFIIGDSAGGGLGLSAIMKIRDEGLRMPDACVTLSAFTDLTLESVTIYEKADEDPVLTPENLSIFSSAYADEKDLKNPLISPLYGNLKKFPPLLMQVGSSEILLDDTIRFAEKAKKAGVNVKLEIWPEMFHVWQTYVESFPEAAEAMDNIGCFVKDFL